MADHVTVMHLRPASVLDQVTGADTRTQRAQRTDKNEKSSFASLLATASSKKATKATEETTTTTTTTPGTDVANTEDKKGVEDIKLRKGEKVKPVEGHAYVDITEGKREGLYINTSGNKRHGEAFQLVMKKGIEYHIYGSGKDRVVVALKPKKDDDAGTDKTSGTDDSASTNQTTDAMASAAASRV
jgi:hypothetical protein